MIWLLPCDTTSTCPITLPAARFSSAVKVESFKTGFSSIIVFVEFVSVLESIIEISHPLTKKTSTIPNSILIIFLNIFLSLNMNISYNTKNIDKIY